MNDPVVTGEAMIARTVRSGSSSINRGALGMLMFLATEAMFFAGLLSALLVLRAGAGVWPPPGQPHLPVAVTGFNTLVLLASGWTFHLALRAIRMDRRGALTTRLLLTAVLGVSFLVVQGFEWVQMVGFGLSVSSGTYGATFYTLIGAHGAHVAGAVIALLLVSARAVRGRYSLKQHSGVLLCQMYWLFVVGVWPVIYGLVYFP